MANPISVPGSVVPSGSLISPGGAQGLQGLQGSLGPAGLAPTGSVVDFAGASAPTGWLLCDGSAVSRTTYSALFAVIGSTYGTGDGSTTFNLPDARGRVTVGTGLGSGLTNRTLAANGGEETHVLSIAELAAHNHPISINDPQHQHGIPGQAACLTGNTAVTIYGGAAAAINSVAGGTGISATSANNGSGTGHNTMMPFITLNKIIKT
jgi:microcystin-dependent protein